MSDSYMLFSSIIFFSLILSFSFNSDISEFDFVVVDKLALKLLKILLSNNKLLFSFLVIEKEDEPEFDKF